MKEESSMPELKETILHQWNLLDAPLLQRLCTSLLSRFLEIASRQGAAIDSYNMT